MPALFMRIISFLAAAFVLGAPAAHAEQALQSTSPVDCLLLGGQAKVFKDHIADSATSLSHIDAALPVSAVSFGTWETLAIEQRQVRRYQRPALKYAYGLTVSGISPPA